MSIPLQALKVLRRKRFYSNGVGVDLEDSYPELFDIIEKALIEKETYQKKVKRYFQLLETRIANLTLDSDEARELIQLEQELKGARK